jgi:RNA polymerase sigma-70 factor (ECF subfamily)
VPEEKRVTELLHELRDGDREAMDRLVPLVYGELRRMAASYLRRENPNHTLQATALVHEAYMRMVGPKQPDFESRTHFYGIASRVMRQILVDHARKSMAAKRGGAEPDLPLDNLAVRMEERPEVMIALDDALQTMEQQDAEKLKLVEFRFFAGMTAEESAELLGIPIDRVRYQLRIAQAWLRREIERNLR